MQAVPILMYHSVDRVGAVPYRRWMVSQPCFDRHMGYLASQGYRPVTMAAMAALMASGQPVPANTVAITFDDGLRDFLTGAMPVLQQYGFAATLFVVAGLVGQTSRWLAPLGEGDRPMLDWFELAELSASGIECGAHTLSHPQLDLLPRRAQAEEIAGSKQLIEDWLGQAVLSFAYPHGYASRTTQRLVREAGFTSACGVRHALSTPGENLFSLSRIIMTEQFDEPALAAALEGRSLPVAPRPARLLVQGWRLARRMDKVLRPVSPIANGGG